MSKNNNNNNNKKFLASAIDRAKIVSQKYLQVTAFLIWPALFALNPQKKYDKFFEAGENPAAKAKRSQSATSTTIAKGLAAILPLAKPATHQEGPYVGRGEEGAPDVTGATTGRVIVKAWKGCMERLTILIRWVSFVCLRFLVDWVMYLVF